MYSFPDIVFASFSNARSQKRVSFLNPVVKMLSHYFLHLRVYSQEAYRKDHIFNH